MHQLVHVTEGYGSAVGGYFQHLEIGVGDSSGKRAVAADAAGRRLRAEQELSDGHRGRELADVREAGDQVGVPEASLLEASLNKVEDPPMPDDVWWAGD
jgi:hypothetical protein